MARLSARMPLPTPSLTAAAARSGEDTPRVETPWPDFAAPASTPADTLGTPTPWRVLVSSQRRDYVYWSGEPILTRADRFAPLALDWFPRPTDDTGRGLHWFPTPRQSAAVVDRFIPELTALRIRWVVVLQGLEDWELTANDYLIDRLRQAGVMPIMRIDTTARVAPDLRRLGQTVARYRARGVRYFQILNEPNAPEMPGAPPPFTPAEFAATWLPPAQIVLANGGLPGLAPLAPTGDDLGYFQAVLGELQRAQRYDVVNAMWIAVHNYGGLTAAGFWRYRAYDARVRAVWGQSLPILATEGGAGSAADTAPVIGGMYDFVARAREPYFFAFCPWLIGNAVGGGADPRWEDAAWFAGTLDHILPRAIVDRAR